MVAVLVDFGGRTGQFTQHPIGLSTVANDEVINAVFATIQLGRDEGDKDAAFVVISKVLRERRHGALDFDLVNDVRVKGDPMGALPQFEGIEFR